jgi:hypothetical protein
MKNNNNGTNNTENDHMTKYLLKQLEHQKKLLFLDLPTAKFSRNFKSKFYKNDNTSNLSSNNTDDEIKTEDGCSLDNSSSDIEFGALPTPASEIAKVAVKSFFNIFIIIIIILINYTLKLI